MPTKICLSRIRAPLAMCLRELKVVQHLVKDMNAVVWSKFSVK